MVFPIKNPWEGFKWENHPAMKDFHLPRLISGGYHHFSYPFPVGVVRGDSHFMDNNNPVYMYISSTKQFI